MNPRKFALIAVAAGMLVQSGAWAEPLEISGGTTPQKDVLEPKAADILKATGVEIKVNGVGTGNGMLALAEGKVTVAAVGDTLADSIEAGHKAAKASNKDVKFPDNLVFTQIGSDELVVIVHKSNPVSSLSKAQLKDLGTGKITNWKDVGGPDLPVKLIVTKAGLIPGLVFQKAMMDGAAYVSGATEVQSPREVITWVSRTPGGFGAAADVHVKAGAGDSKVIKSPPMSRPLGLVTIGAPSGAAKKVADFLKSK
ncbi:substrate-binding domain-containing protein [Oxalobacteraceae bacterium]|nr:substrate-binding domain-containing protein [Oxalobacteraceae bacterium]